MFNALSGHALDMLTYRPESRRLLIMRW